jgi:hypothetical protein
VTGDPFDFRCEGCRAGLLATSDNLAPRFCDSVCEANAAVRAELIRHRVNGIVQWLRDRVRWFLR